MWWLQGHFIILNILVYGSEKESISIHGKQNKTKFQTETRLLPIKGFELEALCYKERLANASGTETVSLMQPNGWKDNLKGNSFLRRTVTIWSHIAQDHRGVSHQRTLEPWEPESWRQHILPYLPPCEMRITSILLPIIRMRRKVFVMCPEHIDPWSLQFRAAASQLTHFVMFYCSSGSSE